jgi:iron complex outermembrane receptor protein
MFVSRGGWAADAAPAAASGPAPADVSADHAAAEAGKVDDLLKLDMDQLSNVHVSTAQQSNNLNAPSTQVSGSNVDFNDVSTTGELARQAPSVSTRRTSAVNLDAGVRGYHSGQLNATANGMNEVKTRLDIDSALSQIDPGIVDNITVIDGPYTSLYGPGFAFLAVDLLPTPRYANGPEGHSQTSFFYGSNGQTLYARETALAGGRDWGACVSYGVRSGDEYLTGGSHPYQVPSSYQKWDDLLTVSKDLSPIARLEFDCIHCEMNGVELPGVVYDLNNSTNNQFNLRYIVQEDRQGPKQLVFQAWYQQTDYQGDASRQSKQDTLYTDFFTLPASTQGEFPVNTVGQGQSNSLGARLLRTFGERESPQWTIGADWRRNDQFYRETSLDPSGQIVLSGGDVYGIPRSQMDDYGVLTDFLLPWSDRVSVNVGGRLDYCRASLDAQDPVVTEYTTDPSQYYYAPGFTEPNVLLGMAYITSKTKLTKDSTLTSGVAYAMRMPDLAELYSDDPFVPIARLGNSYASGFSELRPEKDLQFDVGISTVQKEVSYGARGFYALVWDYIEPVPAFIDPAAPPDLATHFLGRNFQDFPPQNRSDLGTNAENADTNQAGYQYVNINLATLAGGELFGEVKLRDWLSVYGTTAYVCGTNWHPVAFVAASSWSASDGKTVPLGHSEGLPCIYPLNGTLGVRLFQPESQRWLVEFSSRMVAAQDNVATSLAELPTPAFVTFALHGHYRVNKHLRLTMAIDNLFNLSYTEPGSLVILNPQGVPTFVKEPGISAVLGVDARF